MIHLILFGPPGSGKGTQSKLLREKYCLVHISTGEILRSEISRGSELGEMARRLIDKGNLVPDDVVIKMLSEAIDRHKDARGFVYDGFPRTPKQARVLDDMLAERGENLTKVLALNVGRKELVKRLMDRAKKDNRSDDGNRQIIENRIKVYQTHTRPLQEYYEKQNKFVCIDGEGSIEDIFERLVAEIDKQQC